jgi:CBS domain containing-hemolysin-like protein
MHLYGEESIALCTAALTLVTLIFCEIAPKSIAVQNAAEVARVVIRPIAAMSTLVYPIGRLCTNLVNAVFAVFDIKIAAEPFVSEEELKLVLSGAAKSGQVDSGEKEMIQNVLDMSETPVREVMTPLVRVVGVEQSTSLVELQNIWRTHRFSRVPVYADRVDNIVGVVYSMRLLEYELKQELLSTIKVEQVTQKPPFYVPESMSVVKLMRELLARKTHMAIVVNEHGGVVGIATFEDCVEEIVGEIYDENDRPDESEINEDYVREVAHDVYDVDCRAFVDDLAEHVGVQIPSSALYDTVGGFTCDCFDRIPNVGETMVVHMASANRNYDDESDDEDDPSNFGSRGRSFSDASGEGESEKVDYCGLRPVRITVLDGGMKILRKVQIRVNDAARLKEVLDGGGVPVPALRNPDDEDADANGRNREASVDEITVDDRTETWQPSR